MKNIYFTCGPSQLYPTVPRHIKKALLNNIGSLSHRSEKFREIYKTTQDNLRKLLTIPKSHRIFFLSSSLEAMERVIENTVDKISFHFVNGSFSNRFYEFAIKLKKNSQKHQVGEGEGYDIEKAKIPKNAELIVITQNETSTGVSVTLDNISASEKLIAVDIVSSAPYVNLNFKKIDLAFFSVQKGFGLPAGLAVLIVSQRAIEKSLFLEKKGQVVGSYHTFSSLLKKDNIFQTPETPNVLAIYLLGRVCKDMLEVGIKKIRKETELKAKLIYDFFDNHPRYKPEVNDFKFRSRTTINIKVEDDKNKILKKLISKGIIISSGYGKFKDTHIRIANFPALSIRHIKNLLRQIGYN